MLTAVTPGRRPGCSHHQVCWTREAAAGGGQDVSVSRADRKSNTDVLAAGHVGSTTRADKQKSDE